MKRFLSNKDVNQYHLIFVFILFALFTVYVLYSVIFPKDYQLINYSTSVIKTKITKDKKYGPINGTIQIYENLLFSKSLKIADNISKEDLWSYNGWFDSPEERSKKYTIGKLKFPYFIEKNKNSDTLTVYKDTLQLKFLISK